MPKFKEILKKYDDLDDAKASYEEAIKMLRPRDGMVDADKDDRPNVKLLLQEMRKIQSQMDQLLDLDVLEHAESV